MLDQTIQKIQIAEQYLMICAMWREAFRAEAKSEKAQENDGYKGFLTRKLRGINKAEQEAAKELKKLHRNAADEHGKIIKINNIVKGKKGRVAQVTIHLPHGGTATRHLHEQLDGSWVGRPAVEIPGMSLISYELG